MDIVFIELVAWLFLVIYGMIESWIDIPNVEIVNLPHSFMSVDSSSINSTDNLLLCILDVHPNLVALTMSFSCDYIDSFESNVTSIHLFNRVCNEEYYTVFNFSRFSLLKELIIGDECFGYVNIFNIDGLNELKSLKIGDLSFYYSSFEIKSIIVVYIANE